MDVTSLFRISASGLNAERTRLEAINSNIANANATRTPEGGPYRRRVPVFQSVNFQDAFPDLEGKGESAPSLATVSVKDITLDRSPLPIVYDPGHPDADASGYVTMPNVNPIKEMVDLLQASRSYENNLAAIENTKDLTTAALDIGR